MDVERILVPASRAVDTWRALRNQHRGRSWPLLLGAEATAAVRLGNRPPADAVAAALAEACTPPEVWVERRRQQASDRIERMIADGLLPPHWENPFRAPPPDDEALDPDWGVPPLHQSVVALGHDEVTIVLFPGVEGWQLPSVLGFGDFNACPSPGEHGAWLQRFAETHGAELMAMSHDRLELSVSRPVTSRASALDLARRLAPYCSEIGDDLTLANVPVGSAGVPALLLEATVWSFWWD